MEPIDIYAMIQPLVQKQVQDLIDANANAGKFSIAQVPAHNHNGVDSNYLNAVEIENAALSAGEGTTLPVASENQSMFYYRTDLDRLYRSNGTAWVQI